MYDCMAAFYANTRVCTHIYPASSYIIMPWNKLYVPKLSGSLKDCFFVLVFFFEGMVNIYIYELFFLEQIFPVSDLNFGVIWYEFV